MKRLLARHVSGIALFQQIHNGMFTHVVEVPSRARNRIFGTTEESAARTYFADSVQSIESETPAAVGVHR